MHQALAERTDLIESRAAAVLDAALLAGEPWTRALGPAPRGSAAAAWHQNGCTIAAYRDRYGIVGANPLGAGPDSTSQKLDAARGRAALQTGQHLARDRGDAPSRTAVAVAVGIMR